MTEAIDNAPARDGSDAAVPVIAIDGTSGSGKGTLARAVAAAMSWHLLDSGALYRIVGVAAQQRALSLDDAATLAAMAADLDIVFDGESVVVDGDDVSLTIRSEAAGVTASRVAALEPVRDALFAVQRGLRRPPGLVADGRDMGTVVFPDAQLKVYLDATVEERAERRYKQLIDKGLGGSLRALRESITERDERDKRRAVSPLVPASDAIQIDSTHLGIDDVIAQVLALASERGLR